MLGVMLAACGHASASAATSLGVEWHIDMDISRLNFGGLLTSGVMIGLSIRGLPLALQFMVKLHFMVEGQAARLETRHAIVAQIQLLQGCAALQTSYVR